jgi:hypothetical protein
LANRVSHRQAGLPWRTDDVLLLLV